jgi:hypothetical protein
LNRWQTDIAARAWKGWLLVLAGEAEAWRDGTLVV